MTKSVECFAETKRNELAKKISARGKRKIIKGRVAMGYQKAAHPPPQEGANKVDALKKKKQKNGVTGKGEGGKRILVAVKKTPD